MRLVGWLNAQTEKASSILTVGQREVPRAVAVQERAALRVRVRPGQGAVQARLVEDQPNAAPFVSARECCTKPELRRIALSQVPSGSCRVRHSALEAGWRRHRAVARHRAPAERARDAILK